jgi:hypothetical protein
MTNIYFRPVKYKRTKIENCKCCKIGTVGKGTIRRGVGEGRRLR